MCLKNILKKKAERTRPNTSVVFYKDEADGLWYADLAGVPKTECVMIEGSDVFLEKWSENLKRNGYKDCNRFSIRIYLEHVPFYTSCLRLIDKDVEGYTYVHSSGHDIYFNTLLEKNSSEDGRFKMWICKCIELIYATPPMVMYLLPGNPNDV